MAAFTVEELMAELEKHPKSAKVMIRRTGSEEWSEDVDFENDGRWIYPEREGKIVIIDAT